MSDIAILKEMIQESATVPLEDDGYDKNKKIVILKEPELTNCSVKISGMPSENQVIVIKADKFELPNTVFTGSRNSRKRADFVIIADIAKKKIIICIEMKSKNTTSKEQEIIQQLKGAKCFVTYCQEIGKEFWGQRKFLDNYVYRFVSIKNIGINKQPTRNKKTKIHDSPEGMLKIGSQKYIQFNNLI